MSESKSLLARLLAKENITVQHGNYTTAYFDVQNRILGLPLWKDDDKDLHDMLVGHEVGHALYTPADGWVDMQKAADDERVPGDYLNVVEDIRIERMIQETYPGIVRSFKKGYTYLHESDFFGIGGRDINALSLMDRINLKAKLRDLIDVEFSDVERPLVDRAFAARTWDEVVAVARELYEFIKSNPQSQSQENRTVQQEPNGKEEQNNGDDEGRIDPGSSTEEEESDNEPKTNDQSSDSESDSEADGEDTDSSIEQRTESDSDKEEKEYEKSAGETEQDLDQVETIRNAQNNAEELLDTNEDGGAPLVIHGLYRRQMEEIVVPFGMVSAARSVSREKYLQTFKEAYENPEKIYANDEWYERVRKEFNTDAEYHNFMTESKRVVSTMAKEFELRKAAYQYSRASTSRSGSLDLQRLHEYKTNDDIFRRVTTLADAKSHGMVMLIDNSASMAEARGPVIRQVLNLAMFCKQVNIPFDVYSFTNRRGFIDDDGDEKTQTDNFTVYDQPEALYHNNVLMTHVLSSSFNRRTYDRAFRELFDLSQNRRGFEGTYDMMSGTPLQDILSGMHMVLKDFKKKHQIQRPIFTVLTDGESNQLNFKRELLADNREKRRNGVRIVLDESRRVLHPKMRMYGIHGEAVTQCLLDGIRAEVPGIRILGYFVANENHEFKSQIYKATGVYDYEVVKEARKVANRNKFVSYDNTLGYDRYFILRAARAADIDATDDEFEVSDKAKRGEITRAFKKYAKSKKGNRVLATQFAEIIS